VPWLQNEKTVDPERSPWTRRSPRHPPQARPPALPASLAPPRVRQPLDFRVRSASANRHLRASVLPSLLASSSPLLCSRTSLLLTLSSLLSPPPRSALPSLFPLATQRMRTLYDMRSTPAPPSRASARDSSLPNRTQLAPRSLLLPSAAARRRSPLLALLYSPLLLPPRLPPPPPSALRDLAPRSALSPRSTPPSRLVPSAPLPFYPSRLSLRPLSSARPSAFRLSTRSAPSPTRGSSMSSPPRRPRRRALARLPSTPSPSAPPLRPHSADSSLPPPRRIANRTRYKRQYRQLSSL